jgi:hypothetical protein
VCVRRCSCNTCLIYVSRFMIAGPRFLSFGTIINSFECLSSFRVDFCTGVRLVYVSGLRLSSLMASFKSFSNLVMKSSEFREAGVGFQSLSFTFIWGVMGLILWPVRGKTVLSCPHSVCQFLITFFNIWGCFWRDNTVF